MTKKYKCRVEYLESTGTQYIDTGVKGKNNLQYKTKINYTNLSTSASNGIGGEYLGNASAYIGMVRANGHFTYLFNNTAVETTKTFYANTDYVIDSTMNNGSQIVKVNNETISTGTRSGTFTSTRNIFLYAICSTNDAADVYGSLKIYYLQIYDNDVLICDFIPVLDNSGRPAMYDQVSGQLFYNQGTGEFTYGRQIIPVEYLESTGTQWIDTGIIQAGVGLKAELKLARTGSSTSEQAFVGRTSGNGYELYLNNNVLGLWNSSGKNVNGITLTQNVVYNVVGEIYSTGISLVVNGSTYSWSGTSIDGILPTTATVTLFSHNGQYYITGRIYFCKLWDNGTLVRDFIPCIDENLTPFMFDLVTNTCYLNAGTGQFKVGPNVEKVWGSKKLRRKLALALANLKKKRKYYCELEYLESTGTQYIDTGIYGTEDLDTELVCQQLQRNASSDGKGIFGAFDSTNANSYYLYQQGNAISHWQLGFGSYLNTSTEIDLNKHIFNFSNYKVYMDGTEIASFNTGSMNTTPYTLLLFNTHRNNGELYGALPQRFYSVKFIRNGVLVRDYIPVLDWNMTPCMYDRVTEQLFYNAGTGDFTAGREIHYVDYLENIIGQATLNYIPTTYTPTTNTNLEAKVRYTGGASGATWAIGSATWWGIHYQGSGPKIGITNSSTDQYQVYTPYTAGNDITLKLDGSNVYADGTLVGSLTKQNASSTLTLFRYSTSANLSWVGRIYYLDIWDNNGYVYKFRPAISEDGTPFMFDQVTHTIYDNAGTGQFSYPAREVEYLESTGTQYIDTGYKPNTNTECSMDFMFNTLDSTYRCPISVRTSDGAADSFTLSSASTTQNAYAFGYRTYWDGPGGCPMPVVGTKYNGTLKSGMATFGSVVGNAGTTITPSNLTAYMFARNDNGTAANFFIGRIYDCQIKDNNSLVRDFVPVLMNGTAGMLDKLTGTLYTNQGTGSFSTGRIIEPEYE